MKSISSYLGFTYHDLANAEFDEVAAQVWKRDFNQAGGVLFARKSKHDRNSPKFYARNAILKYYRKQEWPRPLEILTMPGLKWQFERCLIAQRDEPTVIHSVEVDAAIYRASLQWIPGRKHSDGIRMHSASALSTYNISHYELTDVERFIASPLCSIYDAAWLDFTGMLTIPRMDAIKNLWENSITDSLTVTSLAARWDHKTQKQINKYGGIPEWLMSVCKRSKLVEVHKYADPSPMIQVMVSR